MPKTLINQFPTETKFIPPGMNSQYLNISEMFCDTLQGEGVYTGHPATFIRLQGCTLACTWCDTLEVWKQGNPYSFEEIFELLESVDGLIDRLLVGQHLVLTGGSPLMQENQLVGFLEAFRKRYDFLPFIEIENEVMLRPTSLISYVDCWNNSPKLSNSGMKPRVRFKPDLIRQASLLGDPFSARAESYFKFVISSIEDWNEIESDFLDTNLIRRDQIILMPCGQTQEELSPSREFVADLAIKQTVRFSDRMHITIWDKKVGV